LAIGPAGRAAAAGAALVLTLGATNAYLSGAGEMIMQMRAAKNGGRPSQQQSSRRPFLLVIAAVGLALIVAYALHLVSTAALVTLPTTMFLTVYLCCTASAARILAGPARIAAWPALIAVAGVLAFCGWALAAAAALAGAAVLISRPARRALTVAAGPAPAARPADQRRAA
jgi:amino acid efflux transporter